MNIISSISKEETSFLSTNETVFRLSDSNCICYVRYDFCLSKHAGDTGVVNIHLTFKFNKKHYEITSTCLEHKDIRPQLLTYRSNFPTF